MKKLMFLLSFLTILVFSTPNAIAQEEEGPIPCGQNCGGDPASSGATCTLCKVTKNGVVEFSCKSMQNESCSITKDIPFGPTVTLSCSNAKEC